MALWIRFVRGGELGFGTLEDGVVHVCTGDLFSSPAPTGETVPLAEVTLRAPVRPSKYLGLVYNYRDALPQGASPPAEPLWFVKAPSAYLDPEEPIRLPPGVGKVVYEGELAVVIGREARGVTEADADACIFGYTCVNDVTAFDLLRRDPAFEQWSRAKSFDTFGPIGPAIATGLDPARLTVRTLLKGRVRQDYACADMIFSPRALVARLSRDVTLLPGDVIACGTSSGIAPIRAGSTVEVAIDGIGTLRNPVAGEAEGAP